MNDITEVIPSKGDTPENIDSLIKDLRKTYQIEKENDVTEFQAYPNDDDNLDTITESNEEIKMDDGKQITFKYLSSFKSQGNKLISFGCTTNGTWYYFTRTGLGTGKELSKPFDSKEAIIESFY